MRNWSPAPRSSQVNYVPDTFQPSRGPSTGWHRRRRRMAPPASTRISARTEFVQGHSSPVNSVWSLHGCSPYRAVQTNLWLCAAESRSALHFDTHHNMARMCPRPRGCTQTGFIQAETLLVAHNDNPRVEYPGTRTKCRTMFTDELCF